MSRVAVRIVSVEISAADGRVVDLRAVELVGRVEVVGVGVVVEVFVEEVALVGSPGVEGVDAGLQVGEHAGQVVGGVVAVPGGGSRAFSSGREVGGGGGVAERGQRGGGAAGDVGGVGFAVPGAAGR